MAKRLPNRIVIERENPNPAGDGAGNYVTGFEEFVGPLWGEIKSLTLSSNEDAAAGQEASRQRFTIEVRRTPKTDQVDARDRVSEPKTQRTFDILSVEKTDRSAFIVFRAELTPLN